MRTIKRLFAAFSLATAVIGSFLVIAMPASVSAAALTKGSDPATCSKGFLTFPTWFRGLAVVQETTPPTSPATYECAIVSPDKAGGLPAFIGHIALNVVEIGLQGVGYVAAAFILYGGFQFLINSGEEARIASARQTILNAVIGLGISIAAVAVVNLLSGLWVYHP